MIDDLTSRGVSEPYRMFTSRAEYRLSLRADNADQRLTPKAMALGCVGKERIAAFTEKMERMSSGRMALESLVVTSKQLVDAGVDISQDGSKRTGVEALAIEAVTWDALVAIEPRLMSIDAKTREQLAKDALYANYIERQKKDIDALWRDESQIIPTDFAFSGIEGLSNELKLKLAASKPANIAQASRIDGMTPSALLLILSKLRNDKPKARVAG